MSSTRNPNIIVIADYGIGDAAFTEVLLQLRLLLPDAYIFPQSTPPFSTINTGFWMYQLAFSPHIVNTYIYSNTAPRKEDKKAQKNNAGEKLMYAKLTNGVEVMAVNAGYVFSFIKPDIEKFHFVNVQNEGSQFRSRDFFPQKVAQMINHDTSCIGKEASTRTIPSYPTNIIVAIDGYGNIKTTTRKSMMSLTPGQPLIIDIHKQRHLATYTDGVFNIKDGELAFAPGSSGHEDKFMELFVRGGSAFRLFDKPNVEEEIKIRIP